MVISRILVSGKQLLNITMKYKNLRGEMNALSDVR
ncbi:hypothetical protein MCY_00919 [Bartonella rattimassiliensis 15908]|uniref:Uncharacterized protein n=1 Tax=Bartonella rattimassiliensis 15908 TaxID=1094556 RepID=J1JNP1_9HYPH|nr:hypothetical protein MCY_00919 [Bartonella rattimassiliensis 15908]